MIRSLDDRLKDYQPLWENWFIDSLIYNGANSRVYRIKRSRDGAEEYAALKVVTITLENDMFVSGTDSMKYLEDRCLNAKTEIRNMIKLQRSPYIVSYYDDVTKEILDDNGEKTGYDILIRMEYLECFGARVRKKEHAVTVQDVINMAYDIGNALKDVHKHNMIHRDIKPDNIFIDEQGYYKLGDLGVSKSINASGYASTRTGTEPYAAPEVWKCDSSTQTAYTYRADIYSFGIVLYQLMNNNLLPFMEQFTHNELEKSVSRRMRGERVPFPANGSDRFKEIICRMCDSDPKRRFDSMSAFLSAMVDVGSREEASSDSEDLSLGESFPEDITPTLDANKGFEYYDTEGIGAEVDIGTFMPVVGISQDESSENILENLPADISSAGVPEKQCRYRLLRSDKMKAKTFRISHFGAGHADAEPEPEENRPAPESVYVTAASVPKPQVKMHGGPVSAAPESVQPEPEQPEMVSLKKEAAAEIFESVQPEPEQPEPTVLSEEPAAEIAEPEQPEPEQPEPVVLHEEPAAEIAEPEPEQPEPVVLPEEPAAKIPESVQTSAVKPQAETRRPLIKMPGAGIPSPAQTNTVQPQTQAGKSLIKMPGAGIPSPAQTNTVQPQTQAGKSLIKMPVAGIPSPAQTGTSAQAAKPASKSLIRMPGTEAGSPAGTQTSKKSLIRVPESVKSECRSSEENIIDMPASAVHTVYPDRRPEQNTAASPAAKAPAAEPDISNDDMFATRMPEHGFRDPGDEPISMTFHTFPAQYAAVKKINKEETKGEKKIVSDDGTFRKEDYHGLKVSGGVLDIPEGYYKIEEFTLYQIERDMIEHINIPSTVTAIDEGAFRNLPNLRSINISADIMIIRSRMFSDCSSLEKVILPLSVRKIEDYAFEGCTSLREVDARGYITSIGKNSFDGCRNLTVKCIENSFMHKYCIKYNIKTEFADQGAE